MTVNLSGWLIASAEVGKFVTRCLQIGLLKFKVP